MNTQQNQPQFERRRVSFWIWGWVIILAVAIGLAIPFWHLVILDKANFAPMGDGRNVATYGFNESMSEALLIRRDLISPTQSPRDYLKPLNDPPHVTVQGLEELNSSMRRAQKGKYLVPSDRVIGVVINGEARAYPIRMINWHEIVNDTLGGVPIAVTYSGPSDSVVVMDRRIDQGQRVLQFRWSGLLYQSNLLMYVKPDDERRASLFSQIEHRAVSGPLAERQVVLDIYPFSLTTWEQWTALHPETSLCTGDGYKYDHYKNNPNLQVHGSPRLTYAAEPLPPQPLGSATQPAWKQRVIALRRDGQWQVTPLQWIDIDATWPADRPVIRVTGDDEGRRYFHHLDDAPDDPMIYAFWYAWYATHPDAALAAPPAEITASR